MNGTTTTTNVNVNVNANAKTAAYTAAAAAAGAAYLLYRSIPALATFVMKMQANPLDEDLGQVIPEKGYPSYESIRARGIVKGKSALVVGGTRGVGYGTALALAHSGASLITVVGRSEASGSRAVSRLRDELSSSSSSSTTKINFLRGDIGTIASTNKFLEKLVAGETRYDYLIVTAAIFPQPKHRNPTPLNEDGVEKSFGIGVVGRFLLYRKAHLFMTPRTKDDNDGNDNYDEFRHRRSHSPIILNVLASGGTMPIGFDRALVRSLANTHLYNIANFAIGNELMLHKLVQAQAQAEEGAGAGGNSSSNSNGNGKSDGTLFEIPIITTHPGFLKTDLHRGQGLLMDVAEAVSVHFIGSTEEECGKREVSLLCAIGSRSKSKQDDNKESKSKSTSKSSLLSIVDHFGCGRLINSQMSKDLNEHGDWLWGLLVLMESGGNLETYND